MARVWVESVGCKVSRADAEALLAELLAEGHVPAPVRAEADVVVLTTCCVTAQAERTSRQRARRLAAGGAAVVVTGCAAVYRAEQFSGFPVVPRVAVRDTVAALSVAEGPLPGGCAGARGALPCGTWSREKPVQAPLVRSGRPERTRAVLKIQDGCSSACTYCAVRLVRGTPWSLPVDEVLRVAEQALARGCGEIVLSGINLGLYAGRPPQGAGHAAGGARTWDLAAVVELLAGLPALQRLRLSSIEPQHLSDRLLAAMRHPRVARHLHVPLQSADDGVLAAMGRPYRYAEYLDLVAAARRSIPGLMLSTDVIVGFPGESSTAFQKTLAAIDATSGLFGRVHVFTFSPRPGTSAAELSPLPDQELRRRRRTAAAAALATREAAARRLVGRRLEVLVEDRRGGLWRGYSSEYVRCGVRGTVRRGTITQVVAERVRNGLVECSIAPTLAGARSSVGGTVSQTERSGRPRSASACEVRSVDSNGPACEAMRSVKTGRGKEG